MPANPSDALPLTPLQSGMLYHWLQNPQSGADVEQMVCTLEEQPDAARLRAAWETAVQQYAALRVFFDWSGLEPAQHIAATAPVPWEERTLPAAEFTDFLHTDRYAAFDLGRVPLMRLTLVHFAEGGCRLVWTFHHLLIDGRSITRILHRVFSLYDGLPAGETVTTGENLPEYLRWQAGLDHSASAAFWKEHLRGMHAAPATVIEGMGTLSATPAQGECDHPLSAETTAAMQALATRAEVTMNTLVQGAWALLISRYTGEDAVVFGATRACRHVPFAGAQDLAGMLINTVPLRTEVPGDQSLIAWLQRLRALWTDMRPHEVTPLPLIRRLAGLTGDQALFNHLVVFENGDFSGVLHGLQPQWQHRRFELRELTTVPLTLQVYGGKTLRLHCPFDTSRFDAVFIRRMLGHLAHLLEQFAAAPEAVLDQYTIATADECRLLLSDDLLCRGPGQVLEFDSGTTLHQWFCEAAARFPDRIAVSGSHGAWTYAELDGRSNAVAAALLGQGIVHGDIVGILMDRSGPLLAGVLGILKAGACYLPIDAAYPADRAAFMLADAGVKTLLSDAAMADKVPAGTFRTLLCDGLPASAPALDLSAHSPDDTAYIIYTSGSTGKPKGCMISHRNVVRLMRATEHWYGFSENDVWTLFHSAAFDFSVWEIWGALLYGGRLCVVPWLTTRSPEDFCRLLATEGVTVLNQTPSAFRQLIAAEPLARSIDPSLPPFVLRYVIFGGEALEMHSLRPWFERHGDRRPLLVNMYGITETTVHVTYRPLSAEDLDRGSVIGEPIPDLQLYVLDPHTRQPAPVGITGEMYVAGAGLAKGYLSRPELTSERFPDNHLTGRARLYKTGDLARVIPAGQGYDLEFLGRIDDQVKIRGFRIELGEIESVLCTHPRITEAAVLVREDRPGDKRLCAWFVSADPPDAAELRAHLKQRLPDYMVPAAFVPMSAFPLTTNGKLDRRALPAPVIDQATRTFTAPATPAEETLAAIWQKVLRVERVGTGDNFFELGGDSILSIQVIARAREAGLHLTPRQLFEHPTVAALAALVSDAKTSAAPAIVAEVAGPFAPSPIQQWFFGQQLDGAHYWNQTFLFSVSGRLERAALTAALHAVIAHHSALRLRFTCDAGAWRQEVQPEPDRDILSFHNLTGLTNGSLTLEIERLCREAQASLNFETGPLLRAVCIDCGDDRPGRLLLTIHHLAVDGVTWRILLEDLEKAYRETLAGRTPALPAVGAPFSAWAAQVRCWAQSPAAVAETAEWQRLLDRCAGAATLHHADAAASNTEAESYVIRTRLSENETEALLQRVPAAWRTRINDALLTALTSTVHAVTGQRRVALHAEGHGREAHTGGNLDVSRTAGWFTTIYPLCLELPENSSGLRAQTLAIREQISALPGHGSGFSALGLSHDAAILFNYLGRMDSLIENSELFSFAPESAGPWHAPEAARKYQIEINAMVIGGSLEVAWTAGSRLHRQATIQKLADAFHHTLTEMVRECTGTAGGPDTSLSGLDRAALEPLLRGQTDITEVSALSPMQQLFYSAAITKPGAGYDQWHCRLTGPLHVETFRQAWSAVLARHSILRSSFHSAGLPHPVQIVRQGVEPEWQIIDATGRDSTEVIAEVLAAGLATRNDLTKPQLSRFTLVRLADDSHFLLWSVPGLHLDGWSWPVVFGEVNAVYTALLEHQPSPLPPALSYHTWLEWLREQPEDRSFTFWREYMRGISAPTPLPVDLIAGPKASGRFARVSLSLDPAPVTTAARALSMSPGAFVQAAWALLLAHSAGTPDVVFGSAFSGRPAELAGVDRIVGPFVNNLPVRLHVDPEMTGGALLQTLQGRLFDLLEHQYTPVNAIQDCTGIPWRSRVFNSIAVFQNYEVGESAKHFGPAAISSFTGPIHTSYPLTLVVTPGETWDAALIYQESACSRARAERILADFAALLTALAANPAATCQSLTARCVLPAGSARESGSPVLRAAGGAPPRTAVEKAIAALWQRAFGVTDLNTGDNFFDLGGGSLLMVRLHAALREELGCEIPLVDLFRYPSIGALARRLEPSAPEPAASGASSASATPAPSPVATRVQDRAAAARAAAAKIRNLHTRN